MTVTVQRSGSPAGAAAERVSLRSYGVLLALILVAFGIEGIAEPGRWELFLLTVLLGATLMMSLRVAIAKPAIKRAVLAVLVVLAALSFADALAGEVAEQWARLANALLVALAPTAIVVGVVRRLRQTRSVPVEAVVGVVCVYVLLGMFFAFLYGFVDRVGNVSFFAGGQAATVSRCLYFSFTTLSTVGYGDLTAASNLGKTLAISEALLGQVYLVTVVSLIVGNLGRQRLR